MTSRRTLIFLGIAVAWTAGAAGVLAEGELVWDGQAWVQPKPADPGTPEGDLAGIRRLIAGGLNKDAVKAVKQFLVEHGESPACEEAMNLAGQALINSEFYWEAYKWYERQISSYPNGSLFARALDREYHIAEAFINGRKRKAMKIFRIPAEEDGVEMLLKISTCAPGTRIAERSLLRVGDYYFARDEYAEAVGVYDDFIKSHPQSSRRQYAMLQAAKAYLLSFRGVSWDDTPLLDARKRFEVFAQAYPRAAQRENVAGIMDEINLSLARKLFHAGEFYERTKHPDAAVYYYRKLVRDYPKTHWAQSAKGRLGSIGPVAPSRPPIRQAAISPQPPDPQDRRQPPDEATTPPAEQKKPQQQKQADKPEEDDDMGPEPVLLEDLTNN